MKQVDDRNKITNQIKSNLDPVATKPVFGVPIKRDSNQSPQLQRLAKKLKFFHVASLDNDTFQKANNKGADQSD